MSGRPRRDVIDEDVVGIYHCWSRCVRQSFLCGEDSNGHNFNHRKDWIYQRLESLTGIFAVDACVTTVMSNHYHLIMRNRPDLAQGWSDEQVVRRWWQLCPERRDAQGQPAEPTPLEIRSICDDASRVKQLRSRLSSISWFMKSMNEHIARRANAEEEQKGHFWQERFGCRRLLDPAAVLAASVYVDLNEIRAAVADTPEESHNTSAYRRILGELLRQKRAQAEHADAASVGQPSTREMAPGDPDFWLCPINEDSRVALLGPPSGEQEESSMLDSISPAQKKSRHGFLPMPLEQYLQLLDLTGRQMASGKRGAIDPQLPPILERLGLRPSGWLQLVEQFDQLTRRAFGSPKALMEEAQRTGRRWLHGVGLARKCFT